MKLIPLRRLSSILLPKPSRLLKEINSNALMVEWSKKHTTEHIFGNRFQLYEMLNATILCQGKIDYLEFGVFRGESLFMWAELNNHPGSRFYGFDTFRGLPEKWDGISRTLPSEHFDTGGSIPPTDDRRVKFITGLFQDTLPSFLRDFKPQGRIVIHNDSDLYSSTLFCLTMLEGILASGSILLFDEFFSSSHEFQAFYDYAVAYRREYRVVAAVGKNPYGQIAIMVE